MRLLEKLHTRYFFAYVCGLSLSALAAMYAAVELDWLSQAQLSSGVDISLKTLAAFASSAWALNRYYTARTDIPQIRVDPTVTVVAGEEAGPRLLLFKLVLVNTAKIQLDKVDVAVTVDAVSVSGDDVRYTPVWRMPDEARPTVIEPGSWSAVNAETLIPSSALAVRIFVKVKLRGLDWTTWHQTFSVATNLMDAATSRPVEESSPTANGVRSADSRSDDAELLRSTPTFQDGSLCGELLTGGADPRQHRLGEGKQRTGLAVPLTVTGVSAIVPLQEVAVLRTGERPGEGCFKCWKCGQVIRLDDENDVLPPCPGCGATAFTP